MKKFRFNENGFAGDIYYPEQISSGEFKSSVVFLYGFPAFIGPNEVTSAIVESGSVAIQPHYYGTYDSDGVFSPKSMVETCQRIEKLVNRGYITNSKSNQPFKLPKISVCVAHSFGCFVALRSISKLTSVKVLVLLAPAVHYSRSNPDFGLIEDGMEQLEYVRESHPFTYRLASSYEWKTLLTGKDPLPSSPNNPHLQKIEVVVGEKDKYFEKEALIKNLPIILKAYCGDKANISIKVVPNRAHPASELVDAHPHFRLVDLL